MIWTTADTNCARCPSDEEEMKRNIEIAKKRKMIRRKCKHCGGSGFERSGKRQGQPCRHC